MLYADYAMDLIELSLLQHANYRADYEKGIAGIGVGIGYLIEKGFLDLGENTFEDLDERMYRAVWYDPYLNLSLYEGKSWLRTRNQYPCDKCLYQICPSPSDYEIILGRPNLCHVHNV